MERFWLDGRFGSGTGEHPLFLQEGLLETMRVTGGDLWAWSRHQARLRRGSRWLGLPLPRNLPSALQRYLERSGLQEGVLRLWLGQGPHGESLLITGEAGEDPRRSGILLGLGSPLPDREPLRQVKRTALLERRRLREDLPAGVEEALLLNARGEVMEALFANLFWRIGRMLYTPARTCGGLPGVTRAWVLRQAPLLGYRVRPGRYRLAEMLWAEEIFLTNSRGGILPVLGLRFAPDWRPLGQETGALQAHYLRSSRFDQIPDGP